MSMRSRKANFAMKRGGQAILSRAQPDVAPEPAAEVWEMETQPLLHGGSRSGSGFLAGLRGLLNGLGAVPENLKGAARSALHFWADSLDRVAASVEAGDAASARGVLDAIEESYDYSGEGWSEGYAAKNEAASAARAAIEEHERPEPTYTQSWFGSPSKNVAMYVADARALAIRLRNRASGGNFDAAALTHAELEERGLNPGSYDGGLITGQDARDLAAAEGAHYRAIEDENRRAWAQGCNPVGLLTGEVTPEQFWAQCVQVPWYVKAGAVGVGLLGAWKLYRWVVR